MNGQGYFAITNDGENLFLQSRSTSGVVKLSSVGEWGFFEINSVASNWQSSGIAYDSDKDSLILFYRNLDDRTQYRARTVDKDNILESEDDVTFTIENVDTTFHGIYAATYHDSLFYFLGVDMSHKDVLIQTDYNYNVLCAEQIEDSTVVGLDFRYGNLYLSYRDRQIKISGIEFD